jgi:hypothetical protein
MKYPWSARNHIAVGGLAAAGLICACLVAPVSLAASAGESGPPTHPSPSLFTMGHVNNQWFPLRAGTKYVY